jgi:hypothetical protein
VQTAFEEQSGAITLGQVVPAAGVAAGEDGYVCLAGGVDSFSLPLDNPSGDTLMIESSFTQTKGDASLDLTVNLSGEDSLEVTILSGAVTGNEGTLHIKIKSAGEKQLLYEGDIGIAYIDFDLALSEISLPPGLSLNETFDPEIFAYRISDAPVSFSVLARAANPAADVGINDEQDTGCLERVIQPPEGDSTVLIRVQSPHGAVYRDYTIAVSRTFFGLSLDAVPVQRVYAVQSLPNEGLDLAGMDVSAATASGRDSTPYTLAYDFTTPGIKTITVNYKGASEVFTAWVVGLAGLSVSGPGGYAPDLSFHPAVRDYDLGTVPYTTDSLNIRAVSGVADIKGAGLAIGGDEAASGAAKAVALAKGHNTIKVVTRLRNEGGEAMDVYTLGVYRAALKNGTEFFVSAEVKNDIRGDGSEEHPYAAVQEVLGLVKNSGLESVPGSFVTITLSGILNAGGAGSNALVDVSGGGYPDIILKGKGTGADAGVLDAGGSRRVLYISDGAKVSLGDNLTLRGGSAGSSSGGGGVYVTGGSSFTMSGNAVIQNTFALHGGGVYVDDAAAFTMDGGTIQGSSASLYGGGVYAGGGASFIMSENALIRENDGPVRGGGVYVNGATFAMEGGNIEKNTSSSGGGVYITGKAAFTLSGGSIRENESEGVYASGDSFAMSGGSIRKNEGNGVYVSGGDFTFSGGSIQGNGGGGVFVYGAAGDTSAFTMNGGSILENTVSSSAINSGGGGVSVYGGKGIFIMNGGTIQKNSALSSSRGGGVFVSGGSFTMNGGSIQGNKTSSYGGGVHLYNASTTFHKTGGTITGSDSLSAQRNTAGANAQGHAVSALNGAKIRTLTAGPDVELSYSGGAYAGGWD